MRKRPQCTRNPVTAHSNIGPTMPAASVCRGPCQMRELFAGQRMPCHVGNRGAVVAVDGSVRIKSANVQRRQDNLPRRAPPASHARGCPQERRPGTPRMRETAASMSPSRQKIAGPVPHPPRNCVSVRRHAVRAGIMRTLAASLRDSPSGSPGAPKMLRRNRTRRCSTMRGRGGAGTGSPARHPAPAAAAS
jgi:hypothetical protein